VQHPTFHNYSRFEKLLIRSQVDGQRQGSRGIELFDIKSRAVAPTRYHLTRYKQFANYKIQYPRGVTRSYELEFYDMVRSVFMKYAFQLRLGGMSGAFVCFHNTREVCKALTLCLCCSRGKVCLLARCFGKPGEHTDRVISFSKRLDVGL